MVRDQLIAKVYATADIHAAVAYMDSVRVFCVEPLCTEPYMFRKKSGALLILYVDDMIIAASMIEESTRQAQFSRS